jgi:hypothetical protein
MLPIQLYKTPSFSSSQPSSRTAKHRKLSLRHRLKHHAIGWYLGTPHAKRRKDAALRRRYCRPCVERRLALSVRDQLAPILKKLETTPLPRTQFMSSFLFAPDGHFLRDEALAYTVDARYDKNGEQPPTREKIVAKDSGLQFERKNSPSGGKLIILSSIGKPNPFTSSHQPSPPPLHLIMTWETDKPESLQVATSWASSRIPLSRTDYAKVKRRLLHMPRFIANWFTDPLKPSSESAT